MNKWTVDDLKMEEIYTMARGCWNNYTKEFDINYSSILTKLIQEAGRWCESYASDLFCDWMVLMKKLSDEAYKGETCLFGFRKMGVDHNAYILSRLDNGSPTDYYRSVWRLDIKVDDNGDIRMYLGKVNI